MAEPGRAAVVATPSAPAVAAIHPRRDAGYLLRVGPEAD